MNDASPVMLITGTRKGIGNHLAKYYSARGFEVIGCSRGEMNEEIPGYTHFCLDVASERDVKRLFSQIRKRFGRLDALINNAGVAAMNHCLLTPMKTVQTVLNTNMIGTFLFCREGAKLMQRKGQNLEESRGGRIVNFVTVAVPLKVAGEAIYAASKAGVLSMTQILAHEFASLDITVNAIGPTPIETDLIRGVPQEKLETLVQSQAIKRFGTMDDVTNAIDFYIQPKSCFITGQVLYLGGV